MPHLSTYVGLADHSERTLADSFRAVADGHAHVADVFHTCHLLARMSDQHRERPRARRPSATARTTSRNPSGCTPRAWPGPAPARSGSCATCRTCTSSPRLVQTTWTVIAQGAQGLRDRELLEIATSSNTETSRQLTWLNTRMKVAAPQALIVAP